MFTSHDAHYSGSTIAFLRVVGIAAFAIATMIALVLLWRQQVSNVQRFWMMVGWLIACCVVVLSYMSAVRNRGKPAQVVPATVIFDAVSFTVGGLIVISFYSSSTPQIWASAMIWSFACLGLGSITGFLFGIPRSRSRGQTSTGLSSVSPPPYRDGRRNVGSLENGAPGAGPNGGDEGNGEEPTAASNAGGPAAVKAPPAQNGADGGANQPESHIAANDGDRPPTGGGDESPIEQISDWLTKIIVGLGLANLKELPTELDRWARYVAPGISASGTDTPPAAAFALGLIIYFLILGFLSCYVLTQMFLLSFINRVRAMDS